jgi:hypothetical protein
MTREEQFNAFWNSYPNKKGKGDARKAFEKAIKLASLDTMLAAITKYVACKPDWQAFKYPGPWLRGEHWDDEWEPQQSRAPAFKTSADRYQSREDFIRASIAKNRAEEGPVNHDMLARLKQAGVVG